MAKNKLRLFFFSDTMVMTLTTASLYPFLLSSLRLMFFSLYF